MTQTRDQAQRRADDIQAFDRELRRLREEQALPFAEAHLQAVAEHQRQVLDTLQRRFDIDPDQQTRRLSLSMRIASLLGALALAASLTFFFYQFWGLFSETVQLAVLIGATCASLLLVQVARQRDASGYFSKLAAMLALASFALNVVMLGQIFNLTPSDNVLLVCAGFALLLAYACNARLLLAAGLLCLMAYISARMGTWGGGYWLSMGDHPENFLPAAVLLFALPGIVSQARFDGFAMTYRLVGLLAWFLATLVLANWGASSYLNASHDSIEGFYQALGFLSAALVIWLGVRRGWADTINTGLVFFILFLFTKLFDWWWEIMPKYLFFLLIGLTAVLVLLVLGRLRRRTEGAAR